MMEAAVGVANKGLALTFAGIPITQRGVTESFIVCTGVGRKEKDAMCAAGLSFF